MKTSTLTGEQIYSNIQQAVNRVKELLEATQMVGEELGKESSAYLLLNQEYSKASTELAVHKSKTYTEYQEKEMWPE